jgi:MerR family transcriptional regulator, copper efflux regulator
MQVSEAAREVGLPVKTIHYYEEIGLIEPERRSNGYRDYGEREVHVLRFLARARSLGFGIEQCRSLLALYRDRRRASADVRALALARIAEVDRKIRELEGLRATLRRLVEDCHGDDRPECPILLDLAGEGDGRGA